MLYFYILLLLLRVSLALKSKEIVEFPDSLLLEYVICFLTPLEIFIPHSLTPLKGSDNMSILF